MQIRRDFDITNLPWYRTGFAPMLFQWSHSHMQRFSSRIPDKNRAIKRGLERKNCAIKKSGYVCQGTKQPLISTKYVATFYAMYTWYLCNVYVEHVYWCLYKVHIELVYWYSCSVYVECTSWRLWNVVKATVCVCWNFINYSSYMALSAVT